MNSIQHTPVVIVGAGPTGLTLAALLGQQGIETVLLEQNASTVREPRAVSIDDEALRTLQALGIADAVYSRLVPGYGSYYLTSKGRVFAKVLPTTREYGYPRRNAFRQPVLEAQLREHVEGMATVRIRFKTRLSAFRCESDRIVVEVTTQQGVEPLACDWLIGCDGAGSLVRQALGVEFAGSTFKERWLIVDLENSNDDFADTRVFCDPVRPCLSLPGPDRTRRFEFMLHDGEDAEAASSPETVAALLARYAPGETGRICRCAVYTFHARVAQKWRQGRVLLAGDAAHLSPPFAGQGMNSGLRDAHNLAWKLACVIRKRIGAQLLDSYELERRPHVWKMIRLAMTMGKVMMPRSRLSAFALQTVVRLAGFIPPAHDYLLQMRYRPKPQFKQGFLLPARGVRQKLIGRLFWQGLVRAVASSHPSASMHGEPVLADVQLLDNVLGNDFALLAFSAQDAEALAQATHSVWKTLQVRRFWVQCNGGIPAVRTDIACVVTIDAALQSWLLQLGLQPAGIWLLRPDHYVAGGTLTQDVDALARQVTEFLAAADTSEIGAQSLNARSSVVAAGSVSVSQ